MKQFSSLLAVSAALVLPSFHAFTSPSAPSRTSRILSNDFPKIATSTSNTATATTLFSSVSGDKIATLSTDTTWRLRFSLNGVPTKNGRKIGELFNVDVQFIEEEGYGTLYTYFPCVQLLT